MTRFMAPLDAEIEQDGIAAVQSTPLINSNGRVWGVISTHFRRRQTEQAFAHVSLDRLSILIADSLEHRNRAAPDDHGADEESWGR